MSYFNQIGQHYTPNPLYDTYRDKNAILEKENSKLSAQISDQLRGHLVRSTMSKPCGLKKSYSELLGSSFCKKPSPVTPFGSSYFHIHESRH